MARYRLSVPVTLFVSVDAETDDEARQKAARLMIDNEDDCSGFDVVFPVEGSDVRVYFDDEGADFTIDDISEES